jgi:hypothetical protein
MTIKECAIDLQNEHMVVVKFDDTIVQLPISSEIKDTIVYVKCDDGKYSISTKDEYLKSKSFKKKATTVDEFDVVNEK